MEDDPRYPTGEAITKLYEQVPKSIKTKRSVGVIE